MSTTSALRGLDRWLTTQPEPADVPLPGDPGYPQCSRCGGFLRRDADRCDQNWVEARCEGMPLDGYETGCDSPTFAVHDPHTYVVHAWVELHRRCRKCGHDNIEVDA